MNAISKFTLVDLVGQGTLLLVIALISIGGLWAGAPWVLLYSIGLGGMVIGAWQLLSGLVHSFWSPNLFRAMYLLISALYVAFLISYAGSIDKPFFVVTLYILIAAALCFTYFGYTIQQFSQLSRPPKSFWDI